MFLKEYDMKVAFPLYEILQECFDSIDGMHELKTLYFGMDNQCHSLVRDKSSHPPSKSRSRSLQHRNRSESPSTRNNSLPA